ncbi:MAG: hypothetical protein IJ374_01230, partial [Lachnospiraceae bacterium]|nr:hypothetical protein [Lachnospiraceae bacterium]
MKKTRRLLAMLLAVIMVVAMMPMTVLAETETGTISITRSDSSINMSLRTFNLYRIFDAKSVENGGVQYSWLNTTDETQDDFYNFFFGIGSNEEPARVEEPEYGGKLDAVIRYINQQNTSAASMAQFTQALLEYIKSNGIEPVNAGESDVTVSSAPTTIVYSNVPLGYYLIEDVTNSEDEGDVVSSLMLDTTTKEVTIELKATRPTIDKFIFDVNDILTDPANGVGTKGASVTVGDYVTYRLAILIPDVSTYNNGYFFAINDTLGDGMSLVQKADNVKFVTIDAKGNKTEVSQSSGDNYHWILVPDSYSVFESKMATDPKFANLVLEVLYGPNYSDTDTVDKEDYDKYFSGGVILIDLYGHNDNHVFTAGETLEIYYDAIVDDTIMMENMVTIAGNSTNEVVLTYTSNPTAPLEELSIDSSNAQVWSHEFKLLKKAADGFGVATGIDLAGAQYELYKKSEYDNAQTENRDPVPMKFLKVETTDGDGVKHLNYYVTASSNTDCVTTLDSNSKGETLVYGLGAGEYMLREIKAPAGYTLPTSDFDLTVTAEIGSIEGALTGMGITSTSSSATGLTPKLTNFAKSDNENGYVEAVLTNIPAEALPSTGGMGTTLFTIGGLLLMCGAAA